MPFLKFHHGPFLVVQLIEPSSKSIQVGLPVKLIRNLNAPLQNLKLLWFSRRYLLSVIEYSLNKQL